VSISSPRADHPGHLLESSDPLQLEHLCMFNLSLVNGVEVTTDHWVSRFGNHERGWHPQEASDTCHWWLQQHSKRETLMITYQARARRFSWRSKAGSIANRVCWDENRVRIEARAVLFCALTRYVRESFLFNSYLRLAGFRWNENFHFALSVMWLRICVVADLTFAGDC
jgi:hypothetical protein